MVLERKRLAIKHNAGIEREESEVVPVEFFVGALVKIGAIDDYLRFDVSSLKNS
jgi:hypothetical protein